MALQNQVIILKNSPHEAERQPMVDKQIENKQILVGNEWHKQPSRLDRYYTYIKQNEQTHYREFQTLSTYNACWFTKNSFILRLLLFAFLLIVRRSVPCSTLASMVHAFIWSRIVYTTVTRCYKTVGFLLPWQIGWSLRAAYWNRNPEKNLPERFQRHDQRIPFLVQPPEENTKINTKRIILETRLILFRF